MKTRALDFLAPFLAAVGFAGFVAVFATEHRAFRAAVTDWAARDLKERTELAAATLKTPLETGDFRRIHEFGEDCTADGVRVTVFSRPGGIVYDSLPGSVGAHPNRPEVEEALRTGEGASLRRSETLGEEFLYSAARCGDGVVRLALPVARVYAPVRRARIGFLLAGFAGGAGVLLVLLVTYRQRAHLAELARERDAQAKRVEEMKRVEAFRRDFIADVSHEIKTPLTGILGAVDMLADGEALPPDAKAALLGMVKKESVRLNALAQNILSLARLEREGESGRICKTHIDLVDIAKETVERLRPKAEAAGMELALEAAGPCETEGDPRLLEQALANLVENAIRHSGSKDIRVSVQKGERGDRLVVEDHGIGIPEDQRGRVFERFHRVDASRAAESGGAGLGLAIVRQIARLHGGDVVLEPTQPSGCRFVLDVPAF